jgi:ribonuclease HI
MKIIIAGTRHYNDYPIFHKTLLKNISDLKIDLNTIEVVSGTCEGVDKMGERFAKSNNLKIHEFPADWLKYGRAAGPIRNRKMAEFADMLICFWDGKSKGTTNMISTANKHKLNVIINHTEKINNHEEQQVIIHTDGSCDNKAITKVAGVGVVMKYKGRVKQIKKHFISQDLTSARAEILGLITALQNVKNTFRVTLICDNQYCVKSITEKWVFSWEKDNFFGRTNADLWITFLQLYRTFPKGYVTLQWVRGHATCEENILCDKLANEARKEGLLQLQKVTK